MDIRAVKHYRARPRRWVAALVVAQALGFIRSTSGLDESIAREMFQHAQFKFFALEHAYEAMQLARIRAPNANMDSEAHHRRRLLQDQEMHIDIGAGNALGSAYGLDLTTCEGLEAEMAAHVAECQSEFAVPPCMDERHAFNICNGNSPQSCPQRAWLIYDRVVELSNRNICFNALEIANQEMLPPSALTDRPCSANKDCCEAELCVMNGAGSEICVPESCVLSKSFLAGNMSVEDCKLQQVNQNPNMLNNREMLTMYNIICMTNDHSQTLCHQNLQQQLSLGLDFSCPQAEALECCLTSFRHFLANCNTSGIWSGVFNYTTLAHVDDIISRCNFGQQAMCKSYGVELSEEDGECHVFISGDNTSGARSCMHIGLIKAGMVRLVIVLMLLPAIVGV